MFISPAYAQAAGGGGGDAFGLFQLLPLVLIFVVFYFLLIRPQQKKQKEHRAMIASVRRGDQVLTGGGILGKVVKVIDENYALVEISEGVRVRVLKSTIADIPSRTGAVPAANAGKADDKRSDKEDDEAEDESEEQDSRETSKT